MAKVIRDVDEEKIRDCKEDIDTLLVFVSNNVLVSIDALLMRKSYRLVSFLPS